MNDFSNSMISFQSFIAPGAFNVTLSNNTVESSNIPILKMSKTQVGSSQDQFINIDGLTVKNCEIAFNLDLILIGQIQTTNSFQITINNLNFDNISFVRGGNLIYFQHQTPQRLVMSNSQFTNIENGGITAKAFETKEFQTICKIKFDNVTVNKVDPQVVSFIQLNEDIDFEIYNSKFSLISNTISGAVLQVSSRGTVASIYNSNFSNNTSVEGAVFETKSEGVIKVYQSNMTNNFAIGSGVIKVSNNGQFEFYGCRITSNYAYYASVSEVFSTSLQSIIDSSEISSNLVLEKDYIINTFIEQDYIFESYRSYIQQNTILLERVTNDHVIQIVFGNLKVQNQTVITSQDYPIYCVYSILNIDGLVIRDSQVENPLILVTESTVIANNLESRDLVSQSKGVQVLLISYSNIILSQLSHYKSNLKLVELLY